MPLPTPTKNTGQFPLRVLGLGFETFDGVVRRGALKRFSVIRICNGIDEEVQEDRKIQSDGGRKISLLERGLKLAS